MNINKIVKSCLIAELASYEHIQFVYTEKDVPSTGKAIYQAWLSSTLNGQPFPVFSGANDEGKLYFTPEINLLYRTLHDIHHAEAYLLGWGTTKIEDEKKLNCKMAYTLYKQALKKYGLTEALEVFFKVYHDTVGQVVYYQKYKTFCEDQKSYTAYLVGGCEGLKFLTKGQTSLAQKVMQGYLTGCNFNA